MRKLMSVILTAAVVASLAGCSGSKNAETTAASQAAETAAETTADNAEAGSEEASAEASEETSKSASGYVDDGVLTVGFDQDFPPMGFVGDDGEFTGFDIELAKEAAKRLGMECKLQPIAWDSKDMELTSGTIDCIWNGFTIQGREDAYEWTTPYMDNSQVFVVRKDDGISSSADLSGKVVEVQADSSAEAALKEMPELTGTFASLQTTPDYNTAFMDLESGAVDAIAMDVIVAGYQIQQRNADFVILDDEIASEQYGVGFAKGNTELRDQIQGALEEMAKDGTLKSISEKWFGKDVTTIK